MDMIERLESFVQRLQQELEAVAPSVDGAVSPGSVELRQGADLADSAVQVRYPSLKGTHAEANVFLTFSIVSDVQQLSAGEPVNRPSITEVDYVCPWLQVYVYHSKPCPFVLWISAERKDWFTRITRAIGWEPGEIEVGVSGFDDRYFLNCLNSGRNNLHHLSIPPRGVPPSRNTTTLGI